MPPSLLLPTYYLRGVSMNEVDLYCDVLRARLLSQEGLIRDYSTKVGVMLGVGAAMMGAGAIYSQILQYRRHYGPCYTFRSIRLHGLSIRRECHNRRIHFPFKRLAYFTGHG